MDAITNRAASLLISESIAPEGWTERDMASAAIALGAAEVEGWSAAERALAANVAPIGKKILAELRDRIGAGEDPLGDLFSQLRSAEERRDLGATYTPDSIVRAMLGWAKEKASPARVVNPGVGSARFLCRRPPHSPKRG